jgi:hypothetical protein
MAGKVHAEIKGPYNQTSARARIEALFLENLGKIVTRAQILEVAKDPKTHQEPENWHQRLSELRTDAGYTILTSRDSKELKVSEYLMPHAEKRLSASKRVQIAPAAWTAVLARAKNQCEWMEGTQRCGLSVGDTDPVGGGTVRLTPDHKKPHAVAPDADPNSLDHWQALCGRHQVMKKNYWDDSTGWLNVMAIVQAASAKVKREVYEFLRSYFRK